MLLPLITPLAVTATAATAAWAHLATTRLHEIRRHFHPATPRTLEHPEPVAVLHP